MLSDNCQLRLGHFLHFDWQVETEAIKKSCQKCQKLIKNFVRGTVGHTVLTNLAKMFFSFLNIWKKKFQHFLTGIETSKQHATMCFLHEWIFYDAYMAGLQQHANRFLFKMSR